MPTLSFRFFLLLAFGTLACCAGYAAVVLGSSSYAEARALNLIFPFYGEPIRTFTAAEYTQATNSLALVGALLLVALVGLSLTPVGRRELRHLTKEVRAAWFNLMGGLKDLSVSQRWQTLGAFCGLTVVRLYFSIVNPEYDDAVSYEVFVSKGLLATSAYYPIPNNHVFSNTISLLFLQVSQAFWWSMRLPVLLISTVTTVFLFAGVLRLAGFRVAAVATGLFSCLQLSMYHAGVGRGYWLMIGLAGVVFFCTLILTESKARRHRAAWAGLVLAGALGCYTVPPFVYVLASAFSWLGVSYLRSRQWVQLSQAAAVGLIIGAAAVTLYGPLLFISGVKHLLGNGYVAALAPSVFWRGLPGYIWHNEGFLAGQRTLGALITWPVLAVVGWLFFQAKAGKLPTAHVWRLSRLGFPALWFVGFPYMLILVQQVFPPERVLLYKAFFFFILLGIVIDWALWRWPAPANPRLRTAIGIFFSLFLIYETYSVERVNPAARNSNAAYHAGLQWLATQPAGAVLSPEPTHNIFLRFYAHSEMRQRQWQIDNDQYGTTKYAYVVAFPNKRGFFQPLFNFPPAYQNQELEIYRVPQNYPLATKAWRH